MIQKIIDELSDSEQSLVNPLLKTKVLASRLGNTKLLEWVNNELNGYNDSDNKNIPKYRIAKANSLCNIKLGYQVEYNTPIPISYIKDESFRNFFREFPLLDGIKTLESYEYNSKGDTLGKPLPVDFWKLLTGEIRKSVPNLTVTNVTISTQISSITQALSEIRSEFLDLMLTLELEFPELNNIATETQENKNQINDKITIIMKQINIKNTGDGSSINTGNDSNINTASGDNIKQEITIEPEKIAEIDNLIAQIKEALAENELEDKEDIEFEIQRIENQLKKNEPKNTIINQSLNTIQSFLLSVTANAWTPSILEGIRNLMSSIN